MSFGIEERALLRHRLAAPGDGARPARRSAGAAGTRPRPHRASTAATRLGRVGRVPHLAGVARDELRVELVALAPWMIARPGARVDLGDRAAAVRLPGSSGGSALVALAMRCVGKIVSPSCAVGTITASIHALASVPSSSWKASAVS